MATMLTFSNVGSFKKALAEAARTDNLDTEALKSRFIEIRPGIRETVLARRHHLITGRRGTGKSSLLEIIRAEIGAEQTPIAAVDMERYKGRAFPDVLIEIIAALMVEMKPQVRAKYFISDWRFRRQFNRLHHQLSILLTEPQSVRRKHSSSTASTGARGSTAGAIATWETFKLGVAASRSKSSEEAVEVTAEYAVLKIEELQNAAGKIAEMLRKLVERSNGTRAYIFIDDFYFVRMEEQAYVLDYLHQVCKGTGVWLKIGGVSTRLRPFRDGNPPVGMQPTQDLDRLLLDVTLEDFATAKRFLESVMQGILQPMELRVTSVFSDDGRNRMVLACGGAVARDYITLTAMACDEAIERLSAKAPKPDSAEIRINATDVQKAARRQMARKEEELTYDADSDVAMLRERWRDVRDFAREKGKTAFVLVRQTDLDESDWGKEILQLENLRFLHRIRDTKPNTPNWRGQKTIVFMLDLAERADQRMRTPIIEFWRSTAEFDRLRRAEWVYSPAWKIGAVASRRSGGAEFNVREPSSPPTGTDGVPVQDGQGDLLPDLPSPAK